MIPAETPPPDDPWLRTEKRTAELLDGEPAPTDVEDTRYGEYHALLEALDGSEWEAGQTTKK